MKPTLHQLKIFRTVAENGSYSRAAEALHLTQPAVSIQVKQLETTVGLPLIEQMGRKIYLTEAGEAIFDCARAIASQLEDTAETIDQVKGIRRGRLRISVASTAGYFVTRLLAAFSDLYPEVAIRLDVTNRASLLQQLDANERDLIVMGEPPSNRNLVSTPFMDNPLVLVAAPDHPLAQASGLTVADLADQTFVVREPGSGTRAAIERFFQARNVSVQFAMEMTSSEAIKQAVQAGLGLGIASAHTLELELETGRLVAVVAEGFPIMRQWYLVHRTGKRLSPSAELFQSFALERCRSRETG